MRWKVEEDNEQGKQLTGLDQYQVRKWTPWHRWITCVMLAHAFLAVQRARHLTTREETDAPGEEAAVPPSRRPPAGPMIRLTVSALAGLLALTGLAVHHGDQYRLAQHHQRAEHQTAAAISHYNRRGDPLPAHLRTHSQKLSQKEDLLL